MPEELLLKFTDVSFEIDANEVDANDFIVFFLGKRS